MAHPQVARAGAAMVQTGFFDLVSNAGMMAKLVLLILLFASVTCWAIIFTKWKTLKLAAKENTLFLNSFWHSKNIEDVFSKVDSYGRSPVASVFKSGVKELKKFSPTEFSSSEDQSVENINRALVRATHSEIALLEKHVGILATTASAAPFIGLFGTVWGIMGSFQSIGATGSANLATVAPGISEALVATAAGIGAAIPAVVAYNHFVGQIRRVAVDIDCFTHDFLNIIQRSMIGRKKGGV